VELYLHSFMTLAVNVGLYITTALARGSALNGLLDILKRRNTLIPCSIMVYLTTLETFRLYSVEPWESYFIYNAITRKCAIDCILGHSRPTHFVRNRCGMQQMRNVRIPTLKFDHSGLPATAFEISTGYC